MRARHYVSVYGPREQVTSSATVKENISLIIPLSDSARISLTVSDKVILASFTPLARVLHAGSEHITATAAESASSVSYLQ